MVGDPVALDFKSQPCPCGCNWYIEVKHAEAPRPAIISWKKDRA